MGSALYVMGGRLRSLGHTYLSYMSTSSVLDIMYYGLAKVKEFSNELTARTLLILHIIALGLIQQLFFTATPANYINMHLLLYNIYTYP